MANKLIKRKGGIRVKKQRENVVKTEKKVNKNIKITDKYLKDLSQELFDEIKSKLKKMPKLDRRYLNTGYMIMFRYNAKYDENPFDRQPLSLIIASNKKYMLGINFHWTPPNMRKKLLEFLFKKKFNKINDSDEVKISKEDLKKIIKVFGKVVRLYLKNRVSSRGILIPKNVYYKAIYLKTEEFVNISKTDAWKYAYISKKQKIKRKK